MLMVMTVSILISILFVFTNLSPAARLTAAAAAFPAPTVCAMGAMSRDGGLLPDAEAARTPPAV